LSIFLFWQSRAVLWYNNNHLNAARTANLFMAKQEKGAKRSMNDGFFLVFLLLVFLFFRGSAKIAEGQTTPNVAGYAWSSNFGWISMNCANKDPLTHLDSCSDNGGNDYGVSINPASDSHPFNLDGYAWSSNAGWISFRYNAGDPAPPDNYKFNTKCNSRTSCLSGNGCTACFNPDDGNIYGWARVINLGNNGWISLGTSSVAAPYQVSIDRTSASGTFSGFAWNGSDDPAKGAGWIRFNCETPGFINQCATSSYFVYLKSSHLPKVASSSAPNWPFAEACAASGTAAGVALNAELEWNFTDPDPGSAQTAFQLLLSASPTTSSPPLLDTGKRNLSASQYLVATTGPDILNYSTAYYWWVRVWDDFGFVSPWHKFDASSGDKLTENDSNSNPQTFTTYKHQMPNAYFDYKPLKPLAYNPVTSTDASYYYTSAAPNTPVNCAKSSCSWLWSGANVLSDSAPNSSSTVITFSYGNNAHIKLHVTDPDGYVCGTTSADFFVDLLPSWKEKQTQ